MKDGSKGYDEIAESLQYPSGGPLTEYLEDLIISGFVEKDDGWSIQTGQELRSSKYRIKDNYLRYYLKYISPHLRKIKKGLFKTTSPFHLPGWEGVLGLQFENLVLNNRTAVWQALDIRVEDIVFENPYTQSKTTKQAGCQIDYAIQTRFKNLYLCEVKFSQHPISIDIVRAVEKKVAALKVPKGFACLPILIHVNGVTQAVIDSGFFTRIVNFSDAFTQ